LSTADVLLPKDIPLGEVSASLQDPVEKNGTISSADEAIEALFRTAATDATIQLLPWLEREFTQRAMQKTGSNQVRAAKLLGITRATLRKRLERNGALNGADDA